LQARSQKFATGEFTPDILVTFLVIAVLDVIPLIIRQSLNLNLIISITQYNENFEKLQQKKYFSLQNADSKNYTISF